MDHTEAVRLEAAEKYLLGELPKEQHAEYEEHYFECSACAEELRATVAFMEGTRQVMGEKTPQAIEDRELVSVSSNRGGWFGWLRPAVAIPVFAALLLFIGYQNGVTIRQLKGTGSSRAAEIIGSAFQVVGSVRGEEASGTKVLVHAREGFSLNFDFTPARASAEYTWQLLDPAGRAVRHGRIGGDKKDQSVSLDVAGGLEAAGKYSLVFFATGDGQATEKKDVQQLTFRVEFLN